MNTTITRIKQLEEDLKDANDRVEFYGEQLIKIKAENALLKQKLNRKKN